MGRPEYSPGQRDSLRAIFKFIDDRLADAEQSLDIAGKREPGAPKRPFPALVEDVTPVQCKVIADYATRVRAVLLAILRGHAMTLPPPGLRASSAARSHLRRACVAAEKLAAHYMAPRDELADELAHELNLASATLIELLEQMESYLAPGSEPPAADRFATGGPRRAQLLNELAHVIDAHGLAELRGTLQMIVERSATPAFEIALFGRVRSGKSSLLNCMLGGDVLPVGVIPSTAIPTRIVHGRRFLGTAWFVDAQTETFDSSRIGEFVSTSQNAANARHVVRLQIALPSPLLPPGLTLVDTPGWGAPSRGGVAETTACVRRCDLGIVLVDGAATLASEDIAIVDALARARAQVLVVLTKADLLSADEHVRVLSYVESQLHAATGHYVSVSWLSVKSESRQLCDRWVAKVLAPCIENRQRLVDASLVRKIAGLRADVMTRLEQRLALADERAAIGAELATGSTRPSDEREVGADLSEALAVFDRLRGEVTTSFPDLYAVTDEILGQAAHNAAVVWLKDFASVIDITAIVVASVDGRAGAASGFLHRRLLAARAALVNACTAATEKAQGALRSVSELPRPAPPPCLHSAERISGLVLARPVLLLPLRRLLVARIGKYLEQRGMRDTIATMLARYQWDLDSWNELSLNSLRDGFLQSASRLARELRLETLAGSSAITAALRHDLLRLREFDAEKDGVPVAAR